MAAFGIMAIIFGVVILSIFVAVFTIVIKVFASAFKKENSVTFEHGEFCIHPKNSNHFDMGIELHKQAHDNAVRMQETAFNSAVSSFNNGVMQHNIMMNDTAFMNNTNHMM